MGMDDKVGDSFRGKHVVLIEIKYISKQEVKLVIFVEGYPKAPIPIATTPRCREGATSFLG